MDTPLLFSLYGVPSAYVAMALLGVPAYLFAKRHQLMSLPIAIVVGLVAAILPEVVWRFSFPWLLVLFYFGVTVAVAFWKLFAFPRTSSASAA